MKRYAIKALLTLAVLFCLPAAGLAIDQYVGDSVIYSASTQYLRPNVLFVVDNSAGMEQPGSREPYDPAIDYTYAGAAYSRYTVYERKTATGGTINYVQYISDISGVTCTTANTSLTNTGFYAGPLKKSDGSCNNPQAGNYFLGNILNYINAPSSTATWQASTTYASGAKIKPTTNVVDANGNRLEYEVVGFTVVGATSGASGATEPTWPTTVGNTVTDGTVIWGISGSIIDMVKTTLNQVIAGARESVNFGVMVFGGNNAGGQVLAPVSKLGTNDPDDATTVPLDSGPANYTALVDAIEDIDLLNANSQPVNETFWDASLYFSGNNDSSTKISSDNTAYPSPIEYTCQKNFIILLTTGSTDTNNPKTRDNIDDADGDGNRGYIDDAAKYLYEGDYSASLEGDQGVQTHVIQLLTPEVARLEEATDPAHGRGDYFHVTNSNELTEALLDAMANIVLESDTSFVAPVVPTSPENRTYSGERVYLGFFKPISQKPWHGNLKKYGINYQNQIVDKNGYVATLDDGSFSDSATSFWSSTTDAGAVEEGGAGALFLADTYDLSARNIYTYRGSSTDLNDSSNAFSTTNITPANLGVAGDAERDRLVNFIYGYDAYDDDGDANTTEKRDWILGDILHSKPQIVNYNTYTPFNATNEANCSVNKTMIYVGTNDGVLHAFRDCDGGEEWAFIPDNLWSSLKELGDRPAKHSYFADASPVVYTYDKDGDGHIGPTEATDGDSDNGSNDKVILLFGQRRGGNAYYALNVTNPTDPQYLWKIDSATTGFGQLGETWSEPNLGKVKFNDSGTEKTMILAFVGAGYDNDNEDGRFGATRFFSNADVVSPTSDSGNVTSAGSTEPGSLTNSPKGRGVYAFEIATLDTNGVPTIASSPRKIWEFTYVSGGFNTGKLVYSFPSDVTVLDTDFDGYVDRLYAGDTGGQMWRFCNYQSSGDLRPLATPLINNWQGKRMFTAGVNLSTNQDIANGGGKKIFYRPSVTYESNNVIALYFGTGDREHPLNTAVVDRFYAVYDKGQRTNEYIDEDNLIDVTTDSLQLDGTDAAARSSILNSLNTSYGWYIQLNLRGGEKVLAPALAFNKVAYFTTYTPNTTVSTNPCSPGNLGVSRLYAVNYKTGEAVLNFTSGNDTESTTNNARALSKSGKVLRRADREITLGVGIPSGLVVVMPPSGDAELLIGCGGGLCAEDPVVGGTIIPIYWMQW